MVLPLAGSVALVAGATRGAGRGTAVALGEAGATVYCTGRSTREQRSEYDRPETIEETAELVSAAGFGWVAGIAVVSTVGAVTLFFAGLKRVGPTSASILSTAEPLTTVLLAFIAFGESLGPIQLAGGALVLGGVLVTR